MFPHAVIFRSSVGFSHIYAPRKNQDRNLKTFAFECFRAPQWLLRKDMMIVPVNVICRKGKQLFREYFRADL